MAWSVNMKVANLNVVGCLSDQCSRVDEMFDHLK